MRKRIDNGRQKVADRMQTLREFRGVAMLFVLAVIVGVAGIELTSALLNDEYERTPSGQGILQINIELASNLFAFAVAGLALVFQLRRRAAEKLRAAEEAQAEIEKVTARKMARCVKEIAQLSETHAKLKADIHAPTRDIWDRSAWDSGRDHFTDHLHEPGLFYALDRFYMAADALRDADMHRAQHIWNPLTVFTRRRTVANIVGKHIENFTVKRDALLPVLREYGYIDMEQAA
jgi:hypothetical protein